MEEFTWGLLGGLLGGPMVELIYVSTLCSEAPNPELCQELGIVTMRVVVYMIPMPLGVSAGVISAGWLVRKVSGNWFLTYIFATAGSLTGLLNAEGVVRVTDFLMASLKLTESLREDFGWSPDDIEKAKGLIYTVTRVALPILYAAFFGTLGFNTGATMQPAPAALLEAPWSIPLFSLRF